MDKLIEVLMQIVGYVPPQLMVVGILCYLIWFHQSHKKEHALILERLETSEKSNVERAEEVNHVYKLVLRSSIVNESIPRSARLDMYDDYKKAGFNSWVDSYAETHLLAPLEPHNRRKEDKIEE